MQRLKYEPGRLYSADEVEHIRIHNMLQNHEKWSMNVFWGFVLFWVLWAAASVTAVWYYWPFS